MKVIATKTGFFLKVRQPGDEFDMPDGSKGSWFKPAPKVGKKPRPLEEVESGLDESGDALV